MNLHETEEHHDATNRCVCVACQA